jgi:hypothetical protein
MWFWHISENIIVKTMYLVSFLINIGLDLSVTTPLKMTKISPFKNNQNLSVNFTLKPLKILIFYAFFCNM